MNLATKGTENISLQELAQKCKMELIYAKDSIEIHGEHWRLKIAN